MKTIAVDPLLNQIVDRTCRELDDEFIRKSKERYKQTDRYKEYEKRKLAELEVETNKEE